MYSPTITEYQNNKSRKSVELKTENGKSWTLNEPTKGHTSAIQPLIWRNIIGIAVLHIMAIYTFVTYYNKAKFWTWIWEIAYGYLGSFGITAGAHRLWTHKTYSAKMPLRILLAYMFCMAGLTPPFKWIRIHRTHHKFSDTPADPHNANRGFFYSHVGWLMMKLHPAVKEHGGNIDMSDVAADPVLRFVDKHFSLMRLLLCFVLPAIVPVYVWNETWTISIGAMIFRYVYVLNAVFSVNSFAHMWGNRPYNGTLRPTENAMVSFIALGEGWHNYHHCFPWDYKTAELGLYRLNTTTAFIDFMAWLGWAYDLKTANAEIIDNYCANKGDGTRPLKIINSNKNKEID